MVVPPPLRLNLLRPNWEDESLTVTNLMFQNGWSESDVQSLTNPTTKGKVSTYSPTCDPQQEEIAVHGRQQDRATLADDFLNSENRSRARSSSAARAPSRGAYRKPARSPRGRSRGKLLGRPFTYGYTSKQVRTTNVRAPVLTKSGRRKNGDNFSFQNDSARAW